MQLYSGEVVDHFDLANISKLSDDLLKRSGGSSSPFSLHIIQNDDAFEELTRFVEFSVFHRQFDYTYDAYHEHYASYGRSSTYLLTIDNVRKVPVGAMRINVDSDSGFPTERILKEVWGIEDTLKNNGISRSDTVDIVSWSVLPEYRGSKDTPGISMHLLHACVKYVSKTLNKQTIIAVMDLAPLKIIQSLGEPFSPLGDVQEKDYDGTLCLPVYFRINDAIQKIKSISEDIYNMVIVGQGFSGVIDEK